MRTTNKQFADLVQKHVIECLSEDVTTELSEQLQNVMDEFSHWYTPYEQNRMPSRNGAFRDWLNGLPSCISLEYYHDKISATLKSWFEECGEEYKEIEDGSKEADLYHHLVVREFFKLYDKNCKQKA